MKRAIFAAALFFICGASMAADFSWDDPPLAGYVARCNGGNAQDCINAAFWLEEKGPGTIEYWLKACKYAGSDDKGPRMTQAYFECGRIYLMNADANADDFKRSATYWIKACYGGCKACCENVITDIDILVDQLSGALSSPPPQWVKKR